MKWLMPTPSTIFAPLVSRAKATATATRKDARATASSSILGRVKAVCNKMLSHATFRSCDIRHFEDNGPRTKKPRCGPGYDGRKAAAARRARQAAAAARNNARAIASFSILGRVISLCNKLLSYVRYLTHTVRVRRSQSSSRGPCNVRFARDSHQGLSSCSKWCSLGHGSPLSCRSDAFTTARNSTRHAPYFRWVLYPGALSPASEDTAR